MPGVTSHRSLSPPPAQRTLLYRTEQTHLATWLELSCDTRQGGSAPEVTEEPIHCRAARYAWALQLARIYEVFPLLCHPSDFAVQQLFGHSPLQKLRTA